MKKIYFVVLMLLVCAGCYSQKVKIKKNIINLDDVEVGTIEKFKNKETREEGFIYSDLKEVNKITLIRYYLNEANLFFVMRPNFSKDTAEIKMEYLSFTLSEQNGLTDLLVKKYHFFNKNGMNMDAINEYLSAGNEPQIPKIQKQIQEQKQAEAENKKAEADQKQAVRDMNIQVIGKGSIVMGRKAEDAGSFTPAPNPNEALSPNNAILIKDEAGNGIALITATGISSTILTYDKNTFNCQTIRSYSNDMTSSYYKEIAEFLALKGYMKGQPNSYLVKKAEISKMRAEEEAKSKEEAIAREIDRKARTEVEGILTLTDGTKVEGSFRFDYRQTNEGRISSEGSIADLDAGKILFHFYKDEKGKDKVKKYGVKEVSTFYINENEVYESVSYKKSGGSKTQRFLLRLAVTEKARLYFYNGEYILMKPDSEDAIAGKTLTSSDLAKFTSDCPEVSQKIKDKGYGNDGKSYIRMVEDYTKCF